MNFKSESQISIFKSHSLRASARKYLPQIPQISADEAQMKNGMSYQELGSCEAVAGLNFKSHLPPCRCEKNCRHRLHP
jgi:hypothetical protein